MEYLLDTLQIWQTCDIENLSRLFTVEKVAHYAACECIYIKNIKSVALQLYQEPV